MITLTYFCPHCEEPTRGPVERGKPMVCMHCGHEQPLKESAWEGQRVTECVLCPSTELYVRKDFSQQLGVSIILFGFALSIIAHFLHHGIWAIGILLATAGIDALLYLVTGNALRCYRCNSELRGLEGLDEHDPFDLEVHERHRQQTARLKQAEAEQAMAMASGTSSDSTSPASGDELQTPSS